MKKSLFILLFSLFALPCLFFYAVPAQAGFADEATCNDMCNYGCAGIVDSGCPTDCQAALCANGAFANNTGSSIDSWIVSNYPEAAEDAGTTTETTVSDDSTVLTRGYLVPQCAVTDPTTCGLCDLIQFIVDTIQFMAGGASAFALLFFVIGGFYWIFSMGNEQRIATGKKIMIGAIVGVVIIIFGWVIINSIIIIASSGAEGFGGEAQLFPGANPTSWFEIDCIQ